MGLLVFAAYIIYDTQLIVERASKGARDAIGDALQLLIDLLGLFVRILVILVSEATEDMYFDEQGPVFPASNLSFCVLSPFKMSVFLNSFIQFLSNCCMPSCPCVCAGEEQRAIN